jgi:hypothetical protein
MDGALSRRKQRLMSRAQVLQRLSIFRLWQLPTIAAGYGLFVAGALYFLAVVLAAYPAFDTYPAGAQFDLLVLTGAPLLVLLAVPLIAWRVCREQRDWFLFLLLLFMAGLLLCVVAGWFGLGFLTLTHWWSGL